MKKYFKPADSEKIKQSFDVLPIKDFNLYYKFHTIYFRLIVGLLDAFEGFAFTQDLYLIYEVFYSENNPISYQAFCDHLNKMQKENLITIYKGEKNIVALKTKAFKLFGSTQTDIRFAKYDSRPGQIKSQMLAQLHLLLANTCKGYQPFALQQDKGKHFIYYLSFKSGHIKAFYLDATGGKLTSTKLIKNLKEISKVCSNEFNCKSYDVNIMSEFADGVQIQKTREFFQDGNNNLANWKFGSPIVSIQFEK